MEDCIKVYHIDDPLFYINKQMMPRYENYREYWGCWVTNKATRTPEKFATYYRMDGTVGHTFGEDDFKRMCRLMKKHSQQHIYPMNDEQFQRTKENLRHASVKQLEAFRDEIGRIFGTQPRERDIDILEECIEDLPDTEFENMLLRLLRDATERRLRSSIVDMRADSVFIVTPRGM